jgi:hypothetical protein
MAQLPRSVRFLQKAESALLSSIEVYNRPTFAYREETFAILALNAWELLLKAKLLAEHDNKPKCRSQERGSGLAIRHFPARVREDKKSGRESFP